MDMEMEMMDGTVVIHIRSHTSSKQAGVVISRGIVNFLDKVRIRTIGQL